MPTPQDFLGFQACTARTLSTHKMVKNLGFLSFSMLFSDYQEVLTPDELLEPPPNHHALPRPPKKFIRNNFLKVSIPLQVMSLFL